ncbi:MAG TPA: nucleotide exchange factor GrpE [Steroidobacteraceae bacterium]|nr:nucleotide exchange factor GrpE [Steroidobacteraceae bacterium]
MSINPDQDPAIPATDAPAVEEPRTTDAERLAADLAAAQVQLTEARDAQLRAYAEMENVRKRAQRDVEAAHRFAIERFALDLIEVRDTLELGIASAGATPEAAKFVEGMQATLRLVDKAFEKAGITTIDPLGQPFNPEFHEAITTQPSAEHAAGSVMAVVQKGFTLNGRLLRAARVVIARPPETAN